MARLEDVACDLRAAIAAEQFAGVRKMTAEYARLLVERWKALAPGDPEALRLWHVAQELLAWARTTVLAQRAQCAHRLAATEALVSYLRGRGRGQHTWQVEG
jgi:hypothetical protein